MVLGRYKEAVFSSPCSVKYSPHTKYFLADAQCAFWLVQKLCIFIWKYALIYFFHSWIAYMYFGIQTFASKRESHLGKVNCGRATETLKCLQVKTREGDISASYRNRRKSNFVEKTAEKNTCLHCVTFVKIINMCQ